MDYVITNIFINDWFVREEEFQYGNLNIENSIDNVLNNINERNPVKLRNFTPYILVRYGIKNLPVYENPSHIRKNILTKYQAQKLGLKISKRDNYHGLGKKKFIKVIHSLDNPRIVFKSTSDNNYFIVTIIKDNMNNDIVVPLEVETTTVSNNTKISVNRIKSVYGFDNTRGYNLNDYIKKKIEDNKFIKIYEKKEQGTGFSTVASSFSNTNIS